MWKFHLLRSSSFLLIFLLTVYAVQYLQQHTLPKSLQSRGLSIICSHLEPQCRFLEFPLLLQFHNHCLIVHPNPFSTPATFPFLLMIQQLLSEKLQLRVWLSGANGKPPRILAQVPQSSPHCLNVPQSCSCSALVTRLHTHHLHTFFLLFTNTYSRESGYLAQIESHAQAQVLRALLTFFLHFHSPSTELLLYNDQFSSHHKFYTLF